MKDFTVEDLAQYDGHEGRPAYVAYEGVVYDLSESLMWSDGDHEGEHTAGHDLTAEQEDAPHDVHVKEFPQIGRLV